MEESQNKLTRKQKKQIEQDQIQKEEQELLSKYQKGLASYYMKQKESVEKEKKFREELRNNYKKDAIVRKYKYRLALRHQNSTSIQVLISLREYARQFLFKGTDDEIIYRYSKKLRTDFQWNVLSALPIGLAYSFAIYFTVRQFKKGNQFDIPIYFCLPLLYWLNGQSLNYSKQAFELGYPAHPKILEKRRACVNKCCFFAPIMIKNEIEYMHSKIDGIQSEKDLHERLIQESDSQSKKYEKLFETGKIGIQKPKDGSIGKKFKIIVEHGQLYIECIDKFEEIFEISYDLIFPDKKQTESKIELTDILDPYLFESHRDIVNALFEVYYEVGDIYLQEFYDVKKGNSLQIQAKEYIDKKYKIGSYDIDKKTEKENVSLQEMEDTKQMLKDSQLDIKRINKLNQLK